MDRRNKTKRVNKEVKEVKEEKQNERKPFHEFKFPKGYLTPDISSDLKHAKIAFKTMSGVYYNKSIEWEKKKEYMKPQLEEFEKYMNKWIKEVVESFQREPLEVFNSTKKHIEENNEVIEEKKDDKRK